MILVGNQRGHALELADHLTNAEDNEHIEIGEIEGFLSGDLHGAFLEIEAAASVTRSTQPIFSLSLSPPEDADVSNETFRSAVHEAMERLGLSGQPHAIVFHEKNGRRHCHAAISRIDADTMKAINLPFYKDCLCELSRSLYLRHDWKLPQGHIDRALSDPLNYSLEEAQTAKRAGRDPKDIKALFKSCWARSDGREGFSAALKEAGYTLCQGDRRGFVAVDADGKIFSLSRWLDIRPKVLRAQLGDPEDLPGPEDVQTAFHKNAAGALPKKADDPRISELDADIKKLRLRKAAMTQTHRAERSALRATQAARREKQIRQFAKEKFSLRGLWRLATGQREKTLRHRREIMDGLEEMNAREAQALSLKQCKTARGLRDDLSILTTKRNALATGRKAPAPLSLFERQADPDALVHAAEIRRNPAHALRLLSDKRAEFSRNDIVRMVARYISQPDELRRISEAALESDELIRVHGGSKANPVFTTRDYLNTQTRLMKTVQEMARSSGFEVSRAAKDAAIQSQNDLLNKAIGAQLSAEQTNAVGHVLGGEQLSAVIGLAGAGKSTLLAAAHDGWTRQGYRVFGAALSGKAADGLQQTSGISSRTLAAWELGWQHGRSRLQKGDVFVIDEAGMVGTRQLARFVGHAKQAGAKIVLVGDPAQLQPLNAGKPFKEICEKTGVAELSEIRRQQEDWQIQASIDFARGRTAEAMRAYEDHGTVETASNSEDAITALAEDYVADLELYDEQKSRTALAHRKNDVFAINQAIRALRKSAGDLQREVTYDTAHGKRSFAAGDRLLFTRNDKALGVRNGTTGTVQFTSKNRITVRFDESSSNGRKGATVTFNPRQYGQFDHGYAVTIHKVQGATVDRAFVLKSPGMDEHLSYVAMTRHKITARVYGLTDEQHSSVQTGCEFELLP